jgi:hypothetical protein
MRAHLLAVTITAFAGGVAHAAKTPPPTAPCDTFGLGEIVYMQIGDTQQPLIKKLGRALRDSAAKPLALVYITSDSCSNIAAARVSAPIKQTTVMSFIPSQADDSTWTVNDPAWTCTPPNPAGQVPDIINSNVFISACDNTPLPATIATEEGAAQAYVLAVPKAQTAVTAITAEEAYFVFGFGAQNGMVTPWMTPAEVYTRAVTASTLVAWANNIGVLPVTKFKGTPLAKSNDVVNALKNASDPQSAIGILGDEVYDANRATLDVLAYKAYGQYHAYWPDSTPSSTDKQNIRDGHYTVWSPTVYMYYQTAGAAPAPVDPDAKWVVDLIANKTDVTPMPDFDATGFVVDVGLVPLCAMKVDRDVEGGNLRLADPDQPCGCYFDSRAGNTPSCAACDASTPCAGTTVCRHNFCEAK